MNILIVTRCLVGYGGVPYSLINLAEGRKTLGKNDENITLLVLDKKADPEILKKLSDLDLNTIVFKNIFYVLLFLAKRGNSFDYLITTCFRSFLLSKLFGFRCYKKIFLWVRGANLINKPFKKLLVSKLNNNIVIVNSRFTGLNNGFIDNEFFVLYNGVSSSFLKLDNNDFYDRFNIPLNAFVILYIGGWSKIKNHFVLIKAFELLYKQFPKLYLLMIGEYSSRTTIAKQYVAKNKIENVVFHDKETFASRYLKKASLYVHPCYAEGFGNAVVEALLADIPVLGARAGALPEFLAENNLFDYRDEQDLANKIKKIINSKLPENPKGCLDEYSAETFYKRFVLFFSGNNKSEMIRNDFL